MANSTVRVVSGNFLTARPVGIVDGILQLGADLVPALGEHGLAGAAEDAIGELRGAESGEADQLLLLLDSCSALLRVDARCEPDRGDVVSRAVFPALNHVLHGAGGKFGMVEVIVGEQRFQKSLLVVVIAAMTSLIYEVFNEEHGDPSRPVWLSLVGIVGVLVILTGRMGGNYQPGALLGANTKVGRCSLSLMRLATMPTTPSWKSGSNTQMAGGGSSPSSNSDSAMSMA